MKFEKENPVVRTGTNRAKDTSRLHKPDSITTPEINLAQIIVSRQFNISFELAGVICQHSGFGGVYHEN